jgi:hypothetical protein
VRYAYAHAAYPSPDPAPHQRAEPTSIFGVPLRRGWTWLHTHISSTLFVPKRYEPDAYINARLTNLYDGDTDESEDGVNVLASECGGYEVGAGDGG